MKTNSQSIKIFTIAFSTLKKSKEVYVNCLKTKRVLKKIALSNLNKNTFRCESSKEKKCEKSGINQSIEKFQSLKFILLYFFINLSE